MRELGFSREWPKLQEPTCTTFRFTRKDRDWAVGEVVRVVLRPRSKGRKVLGTAEIVGKEPRWMAWDSHCQFEVPFISNEEANADGFADRMGDEGTPVSGYYDMWAWLSKTHGLQRFYSEPMNKLSLRWNEKHEQGKS